MNRIPEPELMDGKDQSEAYAQADFTEVNTDFVHRLIKTHCLNGLARAIDLGCGPAEIPALLLQHHPRLAITAVDGSREMLKWAEERIRREQISGLSLVLATLPLEPPQMPYELIFSNSLLHHLHDPSVLWEELKRQGQEGSKVFIMDLCRPDSETRAMEIVEEYAGSEPDVLKHDFYHSLKAAFTPGELTAQLNMANLQQLQVKQITDRHLLIWGTL